MFNLQLFSLSVSVWSRALLLIVLCGGMSLAQAAEESKQTTPQLKSGVFDPPRMAPDFSFPASNGSEFSLSQQRGKLLVLGFGFSNCPNVCPMTLANLAQVFKNLGPLADKVQVVYMTVDPERDTPEQLRKYLAHFNASFIGVTGPAEQLASVRQSYGIIAQKEMHKNGKDYDVHHSSYIYLIDQQGLLRALVPFGKSANDITHDIRILLNEASAAPASQGQAAP